MVYNEVASDGVVLCGRAINQVSRVYTTVYGVGDIAYNKNKAVKGILEKIVIKNILPIKFSLNHGQFSVLYKDTLNALWNEYDLVTLDVAKELSIIYYENLLEDLQKLEEKANC